MAETQTSRPTALPVEIARLDRLATALDSRYRIPGTGIRFGWDTILGLVPGIGDAASLLPTAYMVWLGHKAGVRAPTLVRMSGNAAIDAVIGTIPILGDVFDVAFKANRRNVELLKSELAAMGKVPETDKRPSAVA